MKKRYLLLVAVMVVIAVPSDLEARPERGYYRDEFGRMLIFRQQPSWFNVPAGLFLTAGGGVGMFAVYANLVQVSTCAQTGHGPFQFALYSNNTTGDRVVAALGCGCISAGGIALLYDWHYHYSRLDEPYIILDHLGMWYEGHGQLNWKDLKGVRLIEEVIYDNEGRPRGTRLLIEIVEIQKRWRIDDSRLNITREALYDFILEYCKAATGKDPRIT
jgi:hypothetical protein